MFRPFCLLPPARIVKENGLAVLIRDAYPVSLGHSLVIPKRHIGS
jgi:diadenosine tetraphosphate (Ap4A) HIT family hydrolase